MQIKKEETEQRIYLGAIKVFEKKSYKEATMKEISKKSGVPIGNIYRYFKNKEVLFDEIVFEVYSTLKFIHSHEELEIFSSNCNKENNYLRNNYITLISNKPREFNILFNSSVGTKYENIIEKLANMSLECFFKTLKNKESVENLDNEFLMILIENRISGFVKISKKYSHNEKLLRNYLTRFDNIFDGRM